MPPLARPSRECRHERVVPVQAVVPLAATDVTVRFGGVVASTR
jgi:hypothetical protein